MFKKTILLLAIVLIVGVAAKPVTRRISWDSKERPRMQLAQAMQIAHEKLNSHEGLLPDDDRFYCINANLAITTSKDGDWTFRFGSKEDDVRWVIVDLDGQAGVRRDEPFY